MTFTISQIKKRIDDGLTLLLNDQLPDGSFLSLSAPDIHLTDDAFVYKTTFVTALILSCLENVSADTRAKNIIRNGIKFLLNEKSTSWSWNYWSRTHKKSSGLKNKIPDDMDDTFAALIAISIHRPHLITSDVLAALRNHLKQTQHMLVGLHNTWITDYRHANKWDDVDLVINSSIGYFFLRHGIPAGEITSVIEKALEGYDEKSLISRYYSSPTVAFYFLSRFLGEKIQRSYTSEWPLPISALETALTLSMLIHLNTPKPKLKKYVEKMLSTAWDAHALYTESIKNKIPFYAGSEALTVAFCVEALSKYMLYE